MNYNVDLEIMLAMSVPVMMATTRTVGITMVMLTMMLMMLLFMMLMLRWFCWEV